MSSSPLLPEAYSGMLPYLTERYGNPQSIHSWGKEAKDAIESARREVALLIGAEADEIYFTASGTESNNWAIKGASSFLKKKGNHIISSSIEHVSIINPLKTQAINGFNVTFVPVDSVGRVDPIHIKEALSPETILISLHHAHSEIGTIQPIKEVGEISRSSNILFHSDGVAAAGLVPVDVKNLGIDLYTLSAQSVSGPKGVAALYIRKGRRLDRFMEGGNQERGRRAGLENVAGIVGFGIAARHARENVMKFQTCLSALRDYLIQKFQKKIPQSYLTGDPVIRLPHHASFYIEKIEGEALVLLLAKEGVAAATGSSCVTGTIKPPSVLTALGISASQARGSVVLTVGLKTTREEIEEAVLITEKSIRFLRDEVPI